MSDTLLIKNDNGIICLALNRPEKRNALDGELIHRLITALDTINQDSQAHILLIYGMGNHFCAGADINWMQKKSMSELQENTEDATQLAKLFYNLYTCKIPTIVVAHGCSLGGALGLLAACDIAIALPESYFEFSEIKIGLMPAIISPYILSLIGERIAKYYFLTGKRFNHEEALRLGLIQEISQANNPLEAGLEIATVLSHYHPEILIGMKQLINRVNNKPISLSLANELAKKLAYLRALPATREKLKTFLEKN